MMIEENDAENILVGGLDEMTEKNLFIYNRQGNWKKGKNKIIRIVFAPFTRNHWWRRSRIFRPEQKCIIARLCKIIGSENNLQPSISAIEMDTNIIYEESLSKDDVSLVLYGMNGDTNSDNFYDQFKTQFFHNTTSGAFKHLCGEYQTSGSFAMWLAAMILKNQSIPATVMNPLQPVTLPIKSVLIYNNYENNHSVMLVGRV